MLLLTKLKYFNIKKYCTTIVSVWCEFTFCLLLLFERVCAWVFETEASIRCYAQGTLQYAYFITSIISECICHIAIYKFYKKFGWQMLV